MSERPTLDARNVVVDLIDDAWALLDRRLDGLTTGEMCWEPVAGCWSIRPVPQTDVDLDADPEVEAPIGVADAATDHYEADPPRVTTIGWRMWHLAVDCFDSYSSTLLGSTGASVAGDRFPLDAGRARAELDAAVRHFRRGIDGCSDAQLWAELGDAWGPYARHNVLDLVQHAAHELIHHGAEISLLRDLHRDRPAF